MAISVDRERHSTAIKLKRLKKKFNEYNEKHIDDKYEYNEKFLSNFEKDITILDAFCGRNKYYTSRGYKNVVTNDKDKSIDADYNLDIDVLLDLMIEENRKFDVVDIDPFGASITYLEKALQLADKGLIMTLGELGHRRWKRLDFIGKHYPNITEIEDIKIGKMITHVISVAESKGIQLYPVYIRDWGNIGRVWFFKKSIENNIQ